RAHGANLQRATFKLLPFTTFDLTPAGQNQRSLQGCSLAAAGRLAVVPDSRIYGPEHHLIGRGIVNAACNRPAIFDESDGNTEFLHAADEFPSTFEWIHDPHTTFAELALIIHTPSGEPSLTISQQVSTQHV